MKKIAFLLYLSILATIVVAQDYRKEFISPTDDLRPLIIWQWMDGLVTKEAITKDLEAFKAAGLAGVQNFQIGGDRQIRVGDPTCAIGSEKWKGMMRWAMDECQRLGLTFGTHNCPGWSSSAYPTVTPEYSMQKLIFSETKMPDVNVTKGKIKQQKVTITLPRPEIDAKYNYYEDICVLALPNDSIIRKESIVNLTEYFDRSSQVVNIPSAVAQGIKGYNILRFGHTTNGKTNQAQAPLSGQGLECDKMRREAVRAFWDAYPQMLIDLAGPHAGKTFNMIEIDSYEAGGQDWSVVLPDEFLKRKKYDIMPYLPYIAGRTIIDSKEESARFKKDLVDVVTSLFAENYYGYMNELVRKTPGMQLMIEPYGTGGQKPFQVLDIHKILREADNAVVATEFWVKPETWGWKDMKRHEQVMRNLQRPLLVAEAFTCWPLHAWKDDPQSLKPICDRAFCHGVNRMMLHAGACNPWTNVEPGMSFGIWGTHFVPNQTWWKAGGARALFDYMARCQSLLQRGVPTKEQWKGTTKFMTYQRTDGDNDILFICNPTNETVSDTISLASIAKGRKLELWDAYNLTMQTIESNDMILSIEPNGSRFVIASGIEQSIETCYAENQLLTSEPESSESKIELNKGWKVAFHYKDADDITVAADTLFDWTSSSNADIRYFSGTATYTNSFTIKKIKADSRFVISLGEVKNLASLTVNGKSFPILWKVPFLLDITSAVRKGKNIISIDVTNLWPNRMIGDEQEPDDIEWSEPLTYTYAPGSPTAGRYMAKLPEWLSNGTPRPSKGRKTVGCFKFFTKDSPLLPSGLLGPVEVIQTYGNTQKTVDLIIFMGQSNMAGRGVVNAKHPEDAPDVIHGAAMEFRAYSDTTQLYPVTKLFGKTEDNPDGINDHQKKSGGMVPAFVNACYGKTKTPIIAVSASEGGTRTAQWQSGGQRLKDAKKRFTTACRWLDRNGYRVRHKVMVWAQGESDADNHVTPEEYKQNLRRIVDEMKSVGVEHCFLVRIGKYNGGNKSLSYEPIQQAQVDFCKEIKDCTMASLILDSFKENGMMKDAFHYYQDAYNIVGEDAGLNTGQQLNALRSLK